MKRVLLAFAVVTALVGAVVGAKATISAGASNGATAIVGAQASAKEHGLDVELLDGAAARRRYPGHVLREDDVAVLDRQAGILNPEGCT